VTLFAAKFPNLFQWGAKSSRNINKSGQTLWFFGPSEKNKGGLKKTFKNGATYVN